MYQQSWQVMADFIIKLKDFDTTYHTIRFITYNEKDKLINQINEGYTPINFVDYKAYKEGNKGLSKKTILITFDDAITPMPILYLWPKI